jgi:hypothetical protein
LTAAPQATCVCKDGSGNNNHAGVLARHLGGYLGGGAFDVNCDVLIFDKQTGAFSTVDGCTTWELLPK